MMSGAIPPALTYYWRTKLPETASYTAFVAKNAPQAAFNMAKVLQIDLEAEQVEQITQEDFGLFSSQFRHRHGCHLLGTPCTWFLLDMPFYTQNLFKEDIFNAIVALIDKVGRLLFTLMGFFDMTFFMFALAIPFHYWTISAAVGKVGAMVGAAFGFSAGYAAVGLRKVFIAFSVVNFLGMMFTFLVPESQGKSLEEIFGDADVETADAENGTST
ncbi:hypothetical protein JRO89_XS03G0040800 [Xanthoceras sorbifolium]|uniref:Uncharacterized protein n=1 Tax=Xanthoceras sorbifolium TaxID=99658 RepID=A0ABQ8I8S9_9ROSI|nr:hypothetical protein JRO89_XS03G0040800 [Xanthoceras sorbifolium]